MTQENPLLIPFRAELAAAASTAALEELRVSWLGKSGRITQQLKTLGTLPPEERKAAGAALNAVKDEITAAIDEKKAALAGAELNAKLASETLDMTLPVRGAAQGRVHPVSQVINEITAIFAELGFSVAEGPDIEDEKHNFDALNIPASHPARQMHDTFYLSSQTTDGSGQDCPPSTVNRLLLRTHTSPVQIRTMTNLKPPMRVLAPGSTYRCDSDQTHTPMFHQVEGFVIDKGIHMGHLKGTIIAFLSAFFEIDNVPVRFRPSFFPFTEPSAEVDIGCTRDKDHITIGKAAVSPEAGGEGGWLEVMGCGMVHPNVLKNCGLDPAEWQGFAFGMGVERLAMLKYGIPDLRTFFDSDARWLRHFGFAA